MKIPKNWTFRSRDVARNFDHHVREQLPWYEFVTAGLAHIARHYVGEGGLVYDLGASTGNVGRAIAETLDARAAHLTGFEKSAEMAARYSGPGNVLVADITRVPWSGKDPADLVVLFLTLMFVEPRLRQALIDDVWDRVKPGGALVVVDKTEPTRGYPATVLARLTLAGKVAAGVDPVEIIEKELSLGGVQRPIDPRVLPDGAVEWFRYGDFAGWLAEKSQCDGGR